MKRLLPYQILVFTANGKNIKSSYNNYTFKISAPTWNGKFELPDGRYYASNIQDYFEYICKKDGENNDNQSKIIYANKIEIRILITA